MTGGSDVEPDVEPDVVEALAESQRLGFLGARPIAEVIAHAQVFTAALAATVNDTFHVVDLGAGGGVPGLVIASQLPSARLTLVDRRAKRTDFLERVVRRLGWTDRVVVECADVADVAANRPGSFDATVARGFGEPVSTIRLASRLVRRGGRIVISEPPAGDRWDADLLAELGLTRSELRTAGGRVAVFSPV